MTLKEIKEKAKVLGIQPKNFKKADLIREIQRVELNQPCFGSCQGSCEQLACLWYKDCLKIK